MDVLVALLGGIVAVILGAITFISTRRSYVESSRLRHRMALEEKLAATREQSLAEQLFRAGRGEPPEKLVLGWERLSADTRQRLRAIHQRVNEQDPSAEEAVPRLLSFAAHATSSEADDSGSEPTKRTDPERWSQYWVPLLIAIIGLVGTVGAGWLSARFQRVDCVGYLQTLSEVAASHPELATSELFSGDGLRMPREEATCGQARTFFDNLESP